MAYLNSDYIFFPLQKPDLLNFIIIFVISGTKYLRRSDIICVFLWGVELWGVNCEATGRPKILVNLVLLGCEFTWILNGVLPGKTHSRTSFYWDDFSVCVEFSKDHIAKRFPSESLYETCLSLCVYLLLFPRPADGTMFHYCHVVYTRWWSGLRQPHTLHNSSVFLYIREKRKSTGTVSIYIYILYK